MPFGARQDDDKSWRLCHRKGRTIRHWQKRHWPDVEIKFQSQAKAKACADELNERWKEYEKGEFGKRHSGEFSDDLRSWIADTIAKHGGMSAVAREKLSA